MRARLPRVVAKVAAFTAVCLVFMFALITVFGNFRFDSRTTYQAVFSNVSGLKGGNFVRIAASRSARSVTCPCTRTAP